MRKWSLLLLILFFSGVSAQYAPGLLIDTDLDRFIYRLSSRTGLKVPEAIFDQPVKSDVILEFLDDAERKGSGVLSDQEMHYIKEIRRYLSPREGLLKWYKEEPERNTDIHLKLNIRLLGDIKPSISSNSSINVKGIANPLLTGNLGKLSFYSGIDVWTEYDSDTFFKRHTYQPYDGIPYNLYGRVDDSSNVRSSDILRGGIRYNAGRIQLETAIDYLKVGPALYYPLTLSGYAPPITYFKGTLDLQLVQYSHTAGMLRFQKDKSKYIYTHRLNACFWNSRLNFGLNEVIINGSSTSEPVNDSDAVRREYSGVERGWEWVYLIPFVPFKFAEHYAGDRDNAALSLDVNLLWPANFRWYAEFFLDDMLAPWKIFSSDFGNKWALTVGGQYFGTLFGRDMEISMEYSRVEPWVYTHFFGASHRYSHFDKCLGSPLGPNSQAIVLAVYSQINRLNMLGIGMNSIAVNSSVRGGKISDVFQHKDPLDSLRFHDSEEKRFLGSGTEWSLTPVLYWSFNQWGKFRIDASYKVELLDDRFSSVLSLWGGLVF
ncbi:MAG TPA: hypothetical protein PLE24_11405 [Chitinispirillaceae bacterium]|nr:hypothetical protein [Chitinispirillaceae bacterium]